MAKQPVVTTPTPRPEPKPQKQVTTPTLRDDQDFIIEGTTNETPVKLDKTNFFENFRKSVGDKTPANVAEVGIKYGRYLAEIRGGKSAKSSSTIARSVVNGHHSAAASLLKNYAIQGKKPSAKVQKLIGQLDNLAAHSLSVAGMDDRTRISMIGQGHKSLDTNVIAQQEQAILSQLSAEAGDIMFAEEALEFKTKEQKLRNTVLSGQGQALENRNKIIEGELKKLKIEKQSTDNVKAIAQLEGELASNKKKELEIVQLTQKIEFEKLTQAEKVEEARQDKILDNLTVEDIAKVVETGENTTGVSVAKLRLKQTELIKEQAERATALKTIRNAETDKKKSMLASSPMAITDNMLVEIEEQKAAGIPFPLATLPGDTEGRLQFTELEILDARKIAAEAGEDEASRARVQRNIAQARALHMQTEELAQNFGIDPNSPGMTNVYGQIRNIYAGGASDVSDKALVDANKAFEAVTQTLRDSAKSPEELKAINHRLLFGRFKDYEVAVNQLVTKLPEDIYAEIDGNMLYSNITDVATRLQAQTARDGANANTSLAESLVTGGKKDKEKPAFNPVREPFNHKGKRALMAKVATGTLTEEFYAAKVKAMFTAFEANVISSQQLAVSNPELLQQLNELQKETKRLLLGDDPDSAVFDGSSVPNLVRMEPMAYIDETEEGEVAIPVVNANGTPAKTRSADFNSVLNVIDNFEKGIKELAGDSGLEFNATENFIFANDELALSEVVQRNVTDNSTKEMLLMVGSPAFAKDTVTNSSKFLEKTLKTIHRNQVTKRKFQREFAALEADTGTIYDKANRIDEQGGGVFRSALNKRLVAARYEERGIDPATNPDIFLPDETGASANDAIVGDIFNSSLQELVNKGLIERSEVERFVNAAK